MSEESAFPILSPVDVNGDMADGFPPWEIGLSKRELLAAMAMHAIISHAGPVSRDDPEAPECLLRVSDTAVDYADAMLQRLSDD